MLQRALKPTLSCSILDIFEGIFWWNAKKRNSKISDPKDPDLQLPRPPHTPGRFVTHLKISKMNFEVLLGVCFGKWTPGISWISTGWSLLLYFSCFHFCPATRRGWTFVDLPAAASYFTEWTQLELRWQFSLKMKCTSDKELGLISMDIAAQWPFLPVDCLAFHAL